MCTVDLAHVVANEPETRALVAALALQWSQPGFLDSLNGLLTLRVLALRGHVGDSELCAALMRFAAVARLRIFQQRILACIAAEMAGAVDILAWPNMQYLQCHSEPYYIYYRLRRQLVLRPQAYVHRSLPHTDMAPLFGGHAHGHRHVVAPIVDPDNTTVDKQLAPVVVRWATAVFLFDAPPVLAIPADLSLRCALLFMTVTHSELGHERMEEYIVQTTPRSDDARCRIRHFIQQSPRCYPVLEVFCASLLPPTLDVASLVDLAC